MVARPDPPGSDRSTGSSFCVPGGTLVVVIGCGMARHLKYFMLFQLDSKSIVFHFVFHEIDIWANAVVLSKEVAQRPVYERLCLV